MAAEEEPSCMPLVLRGSLITLKRKCGQPGCHCARGELHESPALSLNVGGKTKILTLRPSEIPQVQTALARYKQARAAAQAALDQQVREGLATLQARHQSAKARERTRVKKGAP
jgi:hypothetical protein